MSQVHQRSKRYINIARSVHLRQVHPLKLAANESVKSVVNLTQPLTHPTNPINPFNPLLKNVAAVNPLNPLNPLLKKCGSSNPINPLNPLLKFPSSRNPFNPINPLLKKVSAVQSVGRIKRIMI